MAFAKLDSCAPTLPVEEFDLHPAPERLDEGIVVAVPDRTHRRQQPGIDRARRVNAPDVYWLAWSEWVTVDPVAG